MIKINARRAAFEINSAAFQFIFDGRKAAGKLRAGTRGKTAVEISFAPTLNGQPLGGLAFTAARRKGNAITVSGAADGRPISIEFIAHSRGVSWSYRLADVADLSRFALGEIRGDFYQIHNFDMDLDCFDIPLNIQLPLQLSSRRVAYTRFCQLDQGNYMMPPYLIGLYDRANVIGLGLLEIPAAGYPLDIEVGVKRFAARFDHSDHPQNGEYASPRFAALLAADRAGMLAAYRAALPPLKPGRIAPRKWWRAPIYTTHGDAVYAKHIEDGNVVTELGASRHLTAELINRALDRLESHNIRPGTVVIDEGWAVSLGDWRPDDSRFNGSLAKYIKQLQKRGFRVILGFNPFLAASDAVPVAAHPHWLARSPEGKPRIGPRVGCEHFLYDWSNPEVRAALLAQLAKMVSPRGLNADGIKLIGLKFIPEPGAALACPDYGRNEQYLLAVMRDISAAVKKAKPDAPISAACMNPLFAPYFDIIRLGNTSEVNHEYYLARAQTCSWLMPTKAIDTDDWAAFMKMIGNVYFMKAVSGAPNIFAALYRGDGRWRGNGALGGAPQTMSPEIYRIISSAWKVYSFSTEADRGELLVDFDRMEFATTAKKGDSARTWQGGHILAVRKAGNIYLAAHQDTRAIIDLPRGFKPARVIRFKHDGSRENVPFQKCLRDKIIFDARSCRDETWYYQIQARRQP